MLILTRGLRHGARMSLALLGAAAAVHAQTAARTPVQSVRPLLDHALLHGSAQGVLTGAAAELIARHFATTAPIELDVAAEGPVDAAGCRRLAVTTSQDGVVDFNHDGKAAAPQRQSFTWRATYCGNGRFDDDVARPRAPAPAPGGGQK